MKTYILLCFLSATASFAGSSGKAVEDKYAGVAFDKISDEQLDVIEAVTENIAMFYGSNEKFAYRVQKEITLINQTLSQEVNSKNKIVSLPLLNLKENPNINNLLISSLFNRVRFEKSVRAKQGGKNPASLILLN